MSDNHITKELKEKEMKTRFKKVFSLWQVGINGSLTELGLPKNDKPFESVAQIKAAILREVNNKDDADITYTKAPLRILAQMADEFTLVPKSQTFEIQD